MTRQIWGQALQIKSKEPSELLRAQHSMASKDWNSILLHLRSDSFHISPIKDGKFFGFFSFHFDIFLSVGCGAGARE